MARSSEVKKILKCKINEATLHSYFIDFDLGDDGNPIQMVDKFVHLLAEEIPNFAFGYHQGTEVQQDEILRILVDAANAIYKIDSYNEVAKIYDSGGCLEDDIEDKYLRRGEFGELILHSLLKYMFDTFPLIAKIYFKDSFGHAVHGFDSIHIQQDSGTLWLGESKLYSDGKRGIDALVDDLFDHFNADYFNSEFNIISKRLGDSKEKIDALGHNTEEWLSLLNRYTKLSEKLDKIVIPMFCAYETTFFNDFNEDDETFEEKYIAEIKSLDERFKSKKNTHPWNDNLNVIVILMPLKSKKQFISKLHRKLSLIQALGV